MHSITAFLCGSVITSAQDLTYSQSILHCHLALSTILHTMCNMLG